MIRLLRIKCYKYIKHTLDSYLIRKNEMSHHIPWNKALTNKFMKKKKKFITLLVGIEPTTFGLEVQHAFLCVTGAVKNINFNALFKFSKLTVTKFEI